MRVEPLAIEVGLGLVGMVEGAQDSPLLRRICDHPAGNWPASSGTCFRRFGSRTTSRCAAAEYLISLKGVEIARYELPQGCELAIASGQGGLSLEGQPTREPAFGISAVWIPKRADGARSQRRIHRGGPNQRAGDASVGVDPPACS